MRQLIVLLTTLAVASPAVAEPRLSLVPQSGENPYLHRARGKSRQATGIALMVLGSLNLAVSLSVGAGMGAACSRPGAECGLADVAWITATVTSGVVGASFLAAGIPLYVQGGRWRREAERTLADSSTTQPWVVPAQLRPNPQRDRTLGLRLLTAGSVGLGVGLVGTVALSACLHANCNVSYLPASLTMIGVGGATGLILLPVGGSYLARRNRAPELASLRLQVGPTVGLSGEF